MWHPVGVLYKNNPLDLDPGDARRAEMFHSDGVKRKDANGVQRHSPGQRPGNRLPRENVCADPNGVLRHSPGHLPGLEQSQPSQTSTPKGCYIFMLNSSILLFMRMEKINKTFILDRINRICFGE